MSELPFAVEQSPACGACNGETTFDGDDFVCEDCQLCFDPNDDLRASFLNPETEPCGDECDNSWHGANKIKPGLSYECGACKLPAGHMSMHWTGCLARLT